MTLAQQIEALMEDHKTKTSREFDMLQRLDSILLHADMQVEANLRRIVTAHTERRDTVLEVLNDLHHMMLGQRAYDELPPITERHAEPIGDARARSLASSIMDQIEGYRGGMN